MNKEKLEAAIIKLIEHFEIKKQIGYRAMIMKKWDANKDKDMNKFLADLILITMKFKEEELNGN